MDIYVGNLSRTTSEEGLRSFFESYGAISAVKIVIDKFTGEPRGFGFVTMANDEEANAAIEALNGKELDGRSLRINQARPQEPRRSNGGPRGGGFNRGGGQSRGGFRSSNSRY